MKKICLFTLICVSSFVCSAQTHGNKLLTIDEMFQLADEKNSTLKLSDLSLQSSDMDVKIAKNERLPKVNVALSAGYLSDIRITDRNFSNGLTVKMKDFGDYAHISNNLVVQASQILYAGGAIKNSIANAKLAQSATGYEKRQSRSNIHFMLLSHYLEIFNFRNQEEVYLKNIEQTEKLVSDIKSKQKEGLALRNDITRYELQLQSLNLALTQVRNNMSVANNRLCTLLKLPRETVIEVDKEMLSFLPAATNEQEWQATANDSSPELKIAQIHSTQADNAEKIINAERLPKIFAFAADQFDGPITIDMDVKDNNMNIWMVGLGVKYNLSSLYTTNKSVKKQQIATKAAQEAENIAKENLQIEVNAAFTHFLESFTILQTAEKSVELATVNYNVINNRFLNDLALLTDMLDASNSKLEAELKMADAKINILFNYFNLKRVAGVL